MRPGTPPRSRLLAPLGLALDQRPLGQRVRLDPPEETREHVFVLRVSLSRPLRIPDVQGPAGGGSNSASGPPEGGPVPVWGALPVTGPVARLRGGAGERARVPEGRLTPISRTGRSQPPGPVRTVKISRRVLCGKPARFLCSTRYNRPAFESVLSYLDRINNDQKTQFKDN